MITFVSDACVDLSAQDVVCKRSPQSKRSTRAMPLTEEAKTLTRENARQQRYDF